MLRAISSRIFSNIRPSWQFLPERCLSGNGQRYEFVADMLGAGMWSDTGSGPDSGDIPRPVEYIKIERNMIRERDGKLRLPLHGTAGGSCLSRSGASAGG